MPSFSVWRGLKVFYFQASLWSRKQKPTASRGLLKDQNMQKLLLLALAAGFDYFMLSGKYMNAAQQVGLLIINSLIR